MRIASSIAFALLTPSFALGFSAGARRVIADIAWLNMEQDARRHSYRILVEHPRLEQDFLSEMPENVLRGNEATKAQWMFQQAACWPDTVRGIEPEEEREKYNHSTWHYINRPTYLNPKDKRPIDLSRVNLSTSWDVDYDTEECLNVIQALKLNIAGYHDEKRTKAQKAVHLCWILHLVGDSHQPMHATAMFTTSLFPKGCRGGNLIQVNGGGNLHSTC